MPAPDDQITIRRIDLDNIAADIATIEFMLDAAQKLAVKSRKMLFRLREEGQIR